jgi:aspartyl-tRNA(Asn)/glutamyl-tRNA(Gln) amidotransferase subunit A
MRYAEPAFATISDLEHMLRTRKFSSEELTKLFLDRLEKLGPRYNALAELTREHALKQARRADKLIRAGNNRESRILGIPYGAKDLLASKGIPTRWGSPAHRDQVFEYDATVIRKLDEAGGVMLGKLAMVELAGGGGYDYASASLHGPGLNPWNIEHWSGGSSSGSGSAVAAGLVPFALGSETWGSIITPSTFCGVTGLRPTWGLVSRYGAMELAWSMDKVGPMARSARDCGIVLEVIAGHDQKDPTTRGAFKFDSRLHKPKHHLGVLTADFTDEPEIEKAFENALSALRTAGVRLTRVELPDYPFADIATTILTGETAGAHGEFIRSDRLADLADEGQKERLKKTLELSVGEYSRALLNRQEVNRELLALFNRFDALVSPSVVGEANTLETNLRSAFRKRGNYSVLGALAGVPAITMPMGLGRQDLPLGLSLTGNLFSENTLLQLGMLFQRETDWHRMHPQVS